MLAEQSSRHTPITANFHGKTRSGGNKPVQLDHAGGFIW